MQTDYSAKMTKAFAGLVSTSELTERISRAAEEQIEFGYGVVRGTIEGLNVKLPSADAQLQFDADLVTGNLVDGEVNGVAIAQVPFNTDHDTTMDDLVAAIEAVVLPGSQTVYAELDPGDANNRTVIVRIPGLDVALTNFAVTGGASQAGVTITAVNDDVFEGVAMFRQKMAKEDGTVAYWLYDDVTVVVKGPIWVPATVAMSYGDTVYLIPNGANRGKFTNVSTNNIATGGKVKQYDANLSLAEVKFDFLG